MSPVTRCVFTLLAVAVVSHAATPILWQPPSVERSHSLAYGPGGSEGAPRPPFRFIKEESSGTTPKVWVRDAKGRTWIAKWGKEVHADVFAPRLAWALGYHASPSYFIRRGRITGAKGLGRAGDYIKARGNFRDARFKLVDRTYRYVNGGWSWDKNPFLGSREFAGLKILMLLVSNWDAKDARDTGEENTAIFVRGKGPGAEYRYAVDDWGAALGGWGHFFARDKWDCAEFAEQNDDFIKGLDERGSVKWGFAGKHADDLTQGITLRDIRWILPYLERISDSDLIAGLRASGTSLNDQRCLARSLRYRINRLRRLAATRPTSVRTARIAAAPAR